MSVLHFLCVRLHALIFADEIMATQTVSVGTSEVLEISPDGVDECTFYMTVNVQDSVSILPKRFYL